MNNITEIKGDLIELAKEGGHFDTILHGANCFSTMGGGIALQIRNNFKTAYLADTKDIRSPLQRLGDFSWGIENSNNGEALTVINLYQQFEPGRNLDYDALRLGLKKVNMIFKNHHIGLPKFMGCGIAGGVWDVEELPTEQKIELKLGSFKDVKTIIKEELKNCKVTIVEYNK